VDGSEPPSRLEQALAMVLQTKGVASHSLAAILHKFDSATLMTPYVTVAPHLRRNNLVVHHRALSPDEITCVDQFRCTTPLRTLTDLAAVASDMRWEHALEAVLRQGLNTIADVEHCLPTLGASRTKGVSRMRRVLALRPENAPPTGSLLETLMVQLIRNNTSLPEPQRQVEVCDRWDQFVARVDLAWPESGVFVELDGQQHKGQPVYDARRETAVVAATGWLPARFTWHEVTRVPVPTLRRLAAILEMGRAPQLRVIR
jgi:very-short-patch-repair endonuclease